MEKILTKKGDVTTCTSAVIVKNKKILLGLRHYTPDKWRIISVWTTPGGRCENGEEIKQNITRETFEETGISNLVFKEYLGETRGVKERDIVHVFLCETNQEPKLMEPEKFSEWKWFSKKEIPENFINKQVLEMIKRLI